MSDAPRSWLGDRPPLELVAGPAPFYVGGEDSLRLDSFNSAASVVLTIVGRFLQIGQFAPTPFVFTQTPNTDSTLKTSLFPLGEGWILNATVFASAGAPTGTQCIALLRLVRGLSGATQVLGTLAQGAITTQQEISWPLTMAPSSTAAAAAATTLRSVTGTDPAAGVEFSDTVPAGKRWRLQAVRVRFVTSAVAAVRQSILVVDDGALELARVYIASGVTAGITWDLTWADRGYTIASFKESMEAGLPSNFILPTGARIRSLTLSMDPGDNYGAPQYLVEESAA